MRKTLRRNLVQRHLSDDQHIRVGKRRVAIRHAYLNRSRCSIAVGGLVGNLPIFNGMHP